MNYCKRPMEELAQIVKVISQCKSGYFLACLCVKDVFVSLLLCFSLCANRERYNTQLRKKLGVC